MKSIFTRIEMLEKALAERKEQERQERLAHEPYVLLKPWSLLKDEYILSYYPEGQFQKPIVYDKISWGEVAERVMQYEPNIDCVIFMDSMIEWLYVFNRYGENSKNYTEYQHHRTTERFLSDHPELVFLHTPEGKPLVDLLIGWKQRKDIESGQLQDILRGGKK